MKKFLTFVLVLAMVMSVSSFAMAEEVQVTTEEELRTALGNGGDITLAADIEVKAGLVINSGKDVTLNLGGKTLSYKPDDKGTTALITNEGSLTIEGQGTITNKATNPDNDWSADNPNDPYPVYANNTISNKGILVVESGTIENKSEGSACYAIDGYAGSTTTIKGGTITAVKTTVRVFNWSSTKATLNVMGGEIYSGDGYGINLNMGNTPNVELNISGGTITTDDTDYNLAVYGVLSNNGDPSAEDVVINVNNGTFNGAFALNGKLSTTMDAAKVSISGGDFESVICYGTPVAGFVSGGTFAEDPSAYLAADYVVSEDANGNYVTAEATEVNVPSDGTDAEVNPVNGGIVKITKEQVADLAGGMSLVVKTANGMEFTFSKDLLSGLLSNGGSYVAIKIEEIAQTKLNDAQQKAIGSTAAKLVFTAEIYVDGEYVGDKLNDNKVQVCIPVGAVDLDTTQPSPNLDGYSLVYISDDGKLEIIANAKEGATEIKAELPHFSEYAVIKTEDANKIIASQKTPATSSSGSGYYGPDVWYIGGNTFGTNTNQVPTSVEIDQVPVSFTMNGSQITVDCIQPGSGWVTVRWGSVSNYRSFTPDANAYCAQAVIPKTGGMSIWAAIAQFLGF